MLKNHWQEVIDHAKVMIKVFSKFATEFRTSSSEDHVLVKFDEEIHCEEIVKEKEMKTILKV